METPPTIIVQLLHLEGPFKGKTQNFSESSILIGRYTHYDVCFPDDDKWDIVSRDHAEIKREGTHFTLINHGVNGTTVSRVREKIELKEKGQETPLRDGDIITFADEGPKVRFLVEVKPGIKPDIPSEIPGEEVSDELPDDIEPIEIQFTIQCGLKIRSFKKLPLTIGKNPGCDFQLVHPAIFDRHAQIFYYNNRYWIKDLTGKNVVRVQRMSINVKKELNPNDEIALSPQGPFFEFIEGIGLNEIEKYPSQEVGTVDTKQEDISPKERSIQEQNQKGKFSRIIKNIWKP